MSTQIVSSSYITSQKARPQILSNGWIVASERDSNTIYFQVSKDNGVSYIPLTTLPFGSLNEYSITSFGTYIHVIVNCYASTYKTLYYKIDCLTSTIVINNLIIDDNQYTQSGCSIAINSTGTDIQAIWSCANSSYPNSYNFRGAKSVNGGTTWTRRSGTAGIDQITTDDDSSANHYRPYVTFLSNDNPIIVYDNNTQFAGTCDIMCKVWNGNTWLNEIQVHGASPYGNQYSPILLTKKRGANIGRLWCLWQGKDAVDNVYFNIKACYSDNNGASWSTMVKLTNGNTVNRVGVSLSEKPNGDIIVMYEDNSNIAYQICANGGTSFTGATTIGAGTTPSISDCTELIGVFIWKTLTDVKSDKFVFWSPPNIKTNINATLKTYVDGWVKIDGTLRHIDSMWVNINGVLKKL